MPECMGFTTAMVLGAPRPTAPVAATRTVPLRRKSGSFSSCLRFLQVTLLTAPPVAAAAGNCCCWYDGCTKLDDGNGFSRLILMASVPFVISLMSWLCGFSVVDFEVALFCCSSDTAVPVSEERVEDEGDAERGGVSNGGMVKSDVS